MVHKVKKTIDETYIYSEAWAQEFARIILGWFNTYGRTFPWRITPNPFHVFIAEILLRQTQAERVVRPYEELVSRYPDARTLAETDVEALRKWFNPIGLVKRADFLVQAAEELVAHYDGEVPSNLEALLQLPGLGTYSARAILCIAFDAHVPMIDESSGRLLRRVLGSTLNGPAFSDRRLFENVEKTLSSVISKSFNFGVLDLAARHCRPKSPDCSECPLRSLCTHARTLGSEY